MDRPQTGGYSFNSTASESLFRFTREFWREQPEKSAFFSLGIEIDQCHTGFRQLEGSTGQRGDHTGKVRLMHPIQRPEKCGFAAAAGPNDGSHGI